MLCSHWHRQWACQCHPAHPNICHPDGLTLLHCPVSILPHLSQAVCIPVMQLLADLLSCCPLRCSVPCCIVTSPVAAVAFLPSCTNSLLSQAWCLPPDYLRQQGVPHLPLATTGSFKPLLLGCKLISCMRSHQYESTASVGHASTHLHFSDASTNPVLAELGTLQRTVPCLSRRPPP